MAMEMELNLQLPEELARAAGLVGDAAAERARFLLLLELYREGRLSLGRFSELAGLSQAELLERMGEHGTYLNYSSDDLAEDRRDLP